MAAQTVFQFVGQGAQYPGMRAGLGAALSEQEPLFAEAEAICGLPLRALIDRGAPADLARTEVTQPALLAMGVTAARALESRGVHAGIVLGHSLGEYAALVHAGALAFPDAVRLVRERGRLMAAAAEATPGGMLAVVGSDEATLAPLLAEAASDGVVELANHNAPRQLVVSGTDAALGRLDLLLRQRRAGRAVPLAVSAPFHSSLLAGLAAPFAQTLADVTILAPEPVFIDNVTGAPERDPARIREKLVQQLWRPVLWEKSVRAAWELGGRRFVECGPGRTLSGLLRRIERGAERARSEELLVGSTSSAGPSAGCRS